MILQYRGLLYQPTSQNQETTEISVRVKFRGLAHPLRHAEFLKS
ncbi:MAG: DUF4278 domain-containing protein [Elainellaceae cyanobacterium]